MSWLRFDPRRRWILLSALFVLALTTVSFSNALRNDFTNWDDQDYVTENPLIRILSFQRVKNVLFSFRLHNYHPLTLLSFALEYRFFRLNPFVYHLDNLILHLFNTALVFWLLYLLTGKKPLAAFVGSLLFGIHPLHVESVAWVTERKDVLSGFFFLAAMIFFLLFLRQRKRGHYFLALAAAALSLLAKPMAVTLPLCFLLLIYLEEGKIRGAAFRETLPFFLLAVAAGILTLLAQEPDLTAQNRLTAHVLTRTVVAAYGLMFYLVKLIVPVGLSCFYPYPDQARITPLSYLLSPPAVILLGILVFFAGRRTRQPVFGALFYLVNLLPVLQLVPIGAAVAADRYAYLPALGIFYLAGVAFDTAFSRPARMPALKKTVLAVALAGVTFTFSFLTWQRNRVWKNSEILWLDVLKKYPDCTRARVNLGSAYLSLKFYGRATEEFRRVLGQEPGNAEVLNILGVTLLEQGLPEEAMVQFQEALKNKPELLSAHNNLGIIYRYQNRLDEAVAEFQTVLRLAPEDAGGHYNLGVTYHLKGKPEEAEKELNESLRINPANLDARAARASIFLESGKFEQGVFELKRILQIDPANLEARNTLALAYVEKGMTAEALPELQKALQMDPENVVFWKHLGRIHGRERRYAEAEAAFREALTRAPEDGEALTGLASAFYAQEKKSDAAVLYQQLLKLYPDNITALNNLGSILAEENASREEGIKLLERALTLSPADPLIMDSVGWAYYQKGNSAQARALLERAAALAPGNEEIRKHLEEAKKQRTD